MLEVFYKDMEASQLNQIQNPNDFDDLNNLHQLTHSLLQQIQAQNAADLRQLSARQDQEQEAILLELYALLESGQIKLDQRLVLALNGQGELHALEHPQAEQVNALLRKVPKLCARMKLLGVLALIERGLTDLRQASLLIETKIDAKIGAKSEHRRNVFQACLCGSLSHFHLTSKN